MALQSFCCGGLASCHMTYTSSRVFCLFANKKALFCAFGLSVWMTDSDFSFFSDSNVGKSRHVTVKNKGEDST